jgi:peptide/nickel transport system permease protein
MTIRGAFKQPVLVAGCLVVLLFTGMAVFAPALAPPVDPAAPQFIPRGGSKLSPTPPGPGHPLGMLPEKYDVFYGLVWGTRAALAFGLLVVFGRVLLGTIVGLISGYAGGLLDALLMRLADAFLAFPMIAATVVMLSLFGFERQLWPGGWTMLQPTRQEEIILLTFVLFGWVPYARLMRGNVLVEREKTYIKAARSTGVPASRLIFRHLLPNSLQGLIALASSDIGAVVVLLSAFTFIGIITPQPGPGMMADWGFILGAARDWIIGPPVRAFEHWYTYMPVSLAIVLFSSGWSLVGDGVRDALDPRLRGMAGVPETRKASQSIMEEMGPARTALGDPAPVRTVRSAAVQLNDQAAFAWLETLAARQGVREGLLLRPEERLATPPDWVEKGTIPEEHRTPQTPHSPVLSGGLEGPPRDGSVILEEARLRMGDGNVSRGLACYRELIHTRECLEEVVQDLSQAPDDPATSEALGDAYLRLGRAGQALEAYRRAMRGL